MLKVNFTVSQLREMIQILDFHNTASEHPDPELELIQARLEEVINVDRWNPLRQLPPLGLKVLLKRILSSEQVYAVRNELAESYSPEVLKMNINGVETNLKTSEWYWTSEYD